jgi:CMP-N-acetylneuraminic acid synthetase
MRAGLVPARGGSKGIPLKNLCMVNGRPMMQYALEALLDSSCEKLFVSTDDESIANFSRSIGAEIVWRPDHLSGDDSPTSDCVAHFLDQVQGVKEVALVQATSPMVLPRDIDSCLGLLGDGFDSAVTMTETHEILWRNGADGMKPMNHRIGERKRRQDMEGTYRETGSVYAFRVDAFARQRAIPCGRVGAFLVEKTRSFQIDDMEDVSIVESIMEKMF